jgi:hypothetical protein
MGAGKIPTVIISELHSSPPPLRVRKYLLTTNLATAFPLPRHFLALRTLATGTHVTAA